MYGIRARFAVSAGARDAPCARINRAVEAGGLTYFGLVSTGLASYALYISTCWRVSSARAILARLPVCGEFTRSTHATFYCCRGLNKSIDAIQTSRTSRTHLFLGTKRQ